MNREAIINPEDFVSKIENMPEIAIACYSHVLFSSIIANYQCMVIGNLDYTDMEKKIYEIIYHGKRFALFMMSVGGPAAATCIEDLHAMGCNKFIVFGNCGVLDSKIDDLGIIIPNRAIRDEGLSFHYMEDTFDIAVNEKYRDIFEKILDKYGYSYVEGITWTTDAFYRETKEKVSKMKGYGAICVEMEVASLQAVCNFRGIDLFTFFYAADNLTNENWDKRSLSGKTKLDEKMQVALLALELAFNISN